MKRSVVTLLCVVVVLAAAGCGSSHVAMNGAGATFPYPIYAKWFEEFNKFNPSIQINYQSIGSGGGIRQLQADTVDFGASDSPMTDEQLSKNKSHVLHFPTVLGAVVATYNLPGVTEELNFTPRALAGIFLGTVQKWNDPEISAANRGVKLPAEAIVPVHRSDGSGTTFVWTDFLSKADADWKSRVGSSTSVNWPAGLGAKGNEGVSGLVKQTPYALGYVELVYALQNQMPYGRVRNAAGKFVKAEPKTVTAAAAAATVPDDFRVSITNASSEEAYPVSSFTWLLVPRKIEDRNKREALVSFLGWMLGDGQKLVETLGYARLPEAVVRREIQAISQIQ